MKISRELAFIFALICLVSSHQGSVCPQNSARDSIQTGLIQFANTKQRQSCQQVALNWVPTNSKINAAASVVSTENYHVNNGVDYSVKVGTKVHNNKFTVTLLSDFSANWTKITLSYIVSGRSDLLMGSFLADSFQTLRCQSQESLQTSPLKISSIVKDWSTSFLNAKAIVFISGLKALSSTINSLRVSTVELNSSGILNIQIAFSKNLQLQLIQISYILVAESFPFQHGYELNHPEYAFSVWQQFKENKLVQVQWGIYAGSLICEGSRCPKKCLTQLECINFEGNSLNGHCHICDKGFVWDGQQCISICGNNEVWTGQNCACVLNAVRVKSACVLCSANSAPNKAQTECICNQGFIWNNWKSSCLPFSCPVNSQPKSTEHGVECVCKPGFYKQGQVCKLTPSCPLNAGFDVNLKRCVCSIQGQFMSGNGVCVSCSRNQTWDEAAKRCQCRPNFILVAGSCVACPAFSTLNSERTKCVCNEGYIWSDWKVACIPFKCPANSSPVCLQSGVRCDCKDGWYLNGDVCDMIPKCPVGATFDTSKKACVCSRKGFFIIRGQCSECPANSVWNGTQCVCNSGFVEFGGVCTFVCGKNEVVQNGRCVCTSTSISINNVCQQCPANSSPNKQKSLCFCNSGFKWDDSIKGCVKVVCPENSNPHFINDLTQCVCSQGFIMQNNLCIRVGRCPPNSLWSQEKLCCTCTNPQEYIINNECRKCGANEQWSEKDKKCVCLNGFHLIGNQCKACQIGQSFNGVGCECNLGTFRNGVSCDKCHSTCGTCSGPANNQCLTCADVTFSFKSGSCVKDTICPKGLYQRGSSCAPCSTYCSDCQSQSTCNTCIDGFQMQSISYGGVTASYCVERCGDGRRFQLDCDDGNNRNGDGCSADCKVQRGWTCTGGSSIRPSTCIQGTPERTFLQLTGTVHLYGRIVQGVRLSYIPQSLTANDCAQCYNLLWVRVIRSDIVPGVRVNYLPKSRYQFLVQFEFHGTFSIPTFNIAIQLNPEYARFFSRRDMAQIQIKTIDPSVLAMKDKQRQLSLDEISVGDKTPIKISSRIVTELFN